MFNIGALRNGREAGAPLGVNSNSASSRAEVLGIDTGAVGGVKPDDLGGLDKVRAERSAPPETPAALEEEELCLRIFPGGEFEERVLLNRETFRVIRMASVTGYIKHTNALDVCSEHFHELLTLRDGI